MFVTLNYLNDCIDYEAELYYLNLLQKQSHVVSSDLLELIPPEVDEFAFAKKQEISKLKIEPIFFQDKAMENLLVQARANNILIFKTLMSMGGCLIFDFMCS